MNELWSLVNHQNNKLGVWIAIDTNWNKNVFTIKNLAILTKPDNEFIESPIIVAKKLDLTRLIK